MRKELVDWKLTTKTTSTTTPTTISTRPQPTIPKVTCGSPAAANDTSSSTGPAESAEAAKTRMKIPVLNVTLSEAGNLLGQGVNYLTLALNDRAVREFETTV